MKHNVITNPKSIDLEAISRFIESVYGKDTVITPQLIKDMKRQLEELEKEKERQKKELLEKEKAQKAEEEAKRHIEEVTSMELPLDWENVFDSDSRAQNLHAESVSDALILSLSNLGRVDIEYISAITGEDYKTVICALKGSIYQNPDSWEECFYKGWETAEEYLSGNLVQKLRRAKAATAAYNGYFDENVAAIKKLLPATLSSKDIYVTLGSPFVPADIIDDFVNHILQIRSAPYYKGTCHDEYTGTWELPWKSYYSFGASGVRNKNVYGTQALSALHIIERTLNMKAVAVTKEVKCKTNKSGVKRVIDRSETIHALEKQQKIIEEFQNWIWHDKKRRKRIIGIFEERYGSVRRRMFDGSFLTFPTMSKDVELYPYQKNAVARILFSPNTLLAHDVGCGKTYVMIAAAMELKRMGLSEKNLFCVPNNIVGQWKSIFTVMYPSAKLLVVEPKDFTKTKKKATLEKIRDNDYDGIIMAYSCFERIPLSRDYYIAELEEIKKHIESITSDKNKATSQLKKKKERVAKELSELVVAIDNAKDNIYFDELGITRLFIDEAHNYKNVPIETKTDKVLGISAGGSKKCQDMLDKVHYVQKTNDGGGVVMATGTPITNSITDAFIMQKYLQSGDLAMLDLQSFDSWIGMFAEKVTEFEIDVDTSGYRLATRFSKFHNLPELTALLSSIADFHSADGSAELPAFDGYTDAVVSRTPEFKRYLEEISARAEMVRSGMVNRKDDNMLKITTDGRKAALDIRLVDKNAGFTYQSKIARCAEKVYDIYVKTKAEKSAQLIFCDTSTPKSGFNIYDELKGLLCAFGIPERDIAYIHDADTERARAKLFAAVRRGDVRILIGSTLKLGLGVNVQDKLVALHHLDLPYRPADMTQREGRIIRQGNTNEKVYIYRYITEGSFDAYSWQLLETKQRFISELLSGSVSERSASDIEDTVLNYAEVKALAVGNPLVKERVETANELSRCLALQKKAIETHTRLESELTEIPAKIAHQNGVIEKCRLDLEFYTSNRRDMDKEERQNIRSALFRMIGENLLMPTERMAMTYQGFSVVLPTNMTSEKPYVWLKKNGKYYIEMGDAEVGVLIRLDNFLDGLSRHLEKLEAGLTELIAREKALKEEIAKKEDYTDRIAKIKARLAKIDKELGVTENE